MTSAAPTRLSRLLAMVPYFQARPGIKLATAAHELGVTEKTLTADLNQLFVCGLPGYGPEHLIDIHFWDGNVSVQFAAGMDRPLRLTGPEANILLIALDMLSRTRGTIDPAAVRSAIAKIEDAMGSTRRAVTAGTVDPDDARPAVDLTLREALAQRRALSLTYYTAGRDEVTDRIVDPIGVRAVDGHTYLEAWCRASEGVRLFRFDRVESARVLNEPAVPRESGTAPESLDFGVLTGELPTARIEIDPDAVWLLEYYAAEPDEELHGQTTEPITATIRYGSAQWLARFVLGFGGSVRVLDADSDVPAMVASAARDARARYSSVDSGAVNECRVKG